MPLHSHNTPRRCALLSRTNIAATTLGLLGRLGLLGVLGQTSAQAGSTIEGRWLGPNGGVIEFAPSCDGALCGRVATSPDGQLAPGTQMTSPLRSTGAASWTGKFYIAPRDTWLDADLRLASPDTLVMKAGMMGGLMCRERQLRRVTE